LINTVLIAVILIAAVSAFVIFNPFAGKSTAATTQLTGTVQQGTVSTTITASGSIAALQDVNADFGTSGTIASVRVGLGATVTKGQVLGTLQTADLSTAVTNAERDLSRAYSDLSAADSALASAESSAKSSPSNGAQSVSSAKQQANSAADAVDTAQASLATAQEDLADATLKAPISGLVVAVNGTVGGTTSGSGNSSSSGSASSSASSGGGSTGSSASSSSSSSTAFMTIANVSKYTVSAAIAEADIANVVVGQDATITFPAITGASSAAKVTAIAPTGTTSNSIVTYATTITLTDPPKNLRLGQTANVTITTASSKADALYVPAAAITTANGVSSVKVIKNGKTTAVTVKTGLVGNEGTEITSGLTAGETIVIGTISATPSTTTGTTGTTGTGGTGGFGNRGGFGGAGGGTGLGGGNRGGFGGGN
jgi:macrolide-specific efflux system membrane fusion protein